MAGSENGKGVYNADIPGDWKSLELGKEIDILTGFAFPSENFAANGIKLLRGSNVKRDELDWNDDITRFWKHDPCLKKYELKSGDLVIALDGALIGRSFAKININDLPCYLVQRVARLRSDKIDQDFLHTLFTQRSFELYVDSVKTHTAIPHISPTDIKKFKVALPPLPEQRAIAHVLGLMDRAIHANNQLLAQKEIRKKWLMQNLLTGSGRLKGFDGEWKELRIESLLKEVTRYVKWDDKDIYRLVSIRRRFGGLFERGDYFGHQIEVKKIKSIHNLDFLISKRQVSHGAWGLVTAKFHDSKVSDEYNCLIPKDDKQLNMVFWDWFCKMPRMVHYAYLASNGVHLEKLIFDFESFQKRKVFIPVSYEEQTAIAQILQTADKEIQLLKAKTEKLREQKKGMMQVLLTGKKRLNIQ